MVRLAAKIEGDRKHSAVGRRLSRERGGRVLRRRTRSARQTLVSGQRHRDQVVHDGKLHIVGSSAEIGIEAYLSDIPDVLRAYIARTGQEGERFARMQIGRQ
jgi:hypothetical protein